MLQLKINYEGQVYDILIEKDKLIGDLKEKIINELENKLNIRTNKDDIIIKMGFPPKSIEDDSKIISECNINDRELIRLTLAVEPTQIINKSFLNRKIIPADNSCLFNSINYAMNNNINEPSIMRELISVEIKSNPELYNSAILEKDPLEYCEWIMRDDTWGGGIELSILSKSFQLRIAVVDIKNVTIEYFGENYSNIIYLLYDGIHYDVLVRQENGKDIGIFNSNDEKLKEEVLKIAEELKKKNHYVNTSNYKIRCNVCYALLKGNTDAVSHSKSTGHTNFVQLDN